MPFFNLWAAELSHPMGPAGILGRSAVAGYLQFQVFMKLMGSAC